MVFHRALWNAYGAIDALSRVNDQRDWPLVETIHGTDVDTIGVLALDAAIGGYMGHEGLLIATLGRVQQLFALTRVARWILIHVAYTTSAFSEYYINRGIDPRRFNSRLERQRR